MRLNRELEHLEVGATYKATISCQQFRWCSNKEIFQSNSNDTSQKFLLEVVPAYDSWKFNGITRRIFQFTSAQQQISFPLVLLPLKCGNIPFPKLMIKAYDPLNTGSDEDYIVMNQIGKRHHLPSIESLRPAIQLRQSTQTLSQIGNMDNEFSAGSATESDKLHILRKEISSPEMTACRCKSSIFNSPTDKSVKSNNASSITKYQTLSLTEGRLLCVIPNFRSINHFVNI